MPTDDFSLSATMPILSIVIAEKKAREMSMSDNDAGIAPPAVTIYTTKLCPYCHMAKRVLRNKGVAFQEIDVTFEPQERAAMRERAGGRHTVPQIFVGSTHIGGCDELLSLDDEGRLDDLLEGKV